MRNKHEELPEHRHKGKRQSGTRVWRELSLYTQGGEYNRDTRQETLDRKTRLRPRPYQIKPESELTRQRHVS